ncbi:hypothetical protein LCGC14_1123780 [marine sediment metagenome]|uniref:Uncharacterized protein n=1 Tax=marine sediment metagenome TaxID=412755 RepID=A0A0F9MR31_9ZZZZ
MRIEKYMPDNKTRRCPAIGLTGQCKRPYEFQGHKTAPHDPPDACYYDGPAHPASYYNTDRGTEP